MTWLTIVGVGEALMVEEEEVVALFEGDEKLEEEDVAALLE